jgi:hypothetical protein
MSSTLEERLDADLPPNKTHKAQFAVMRRKEWTEMFSSSYSVFFSSGYTYERLLNLSRTVQGKTEILEDLLWMRSMENPPISSVNVPRRGTGDFVTWATSPEFEEEIAIYRSIALGILQRGGLDEAKARIYEERFFLGGVQRQATKQAKNAKSLKRKVAKIVLTRTPKKVRLLAKRLVPNRLLGFTGWQGFKLKEMYELLASRKTNFVPAELERVADLSLRLNKKIHG